MAGPTGVEDGEDFLDVFDAEDGKRCDVDDAAEELPSAHEGAAEWAEGPLGP